MKTLSNSTIHRNSGKGGSFMKIEVWLSADGGEDIYTTIEVPEDASEDEIEKLARQAIFKKTSWGWYLVKEK